MNPDWAILGARQYSGSGVMLVASNQLRSMSVTMEYEYFERRNAFGTFAVREAMADRIELAAVLDNCVIIYAPDYPSALARLPDLFNAWERGERWHQPAVSVAPPALESGGG